MVHREGLKLVTVEEISPDNVGINMDNFSEEKILSVLSGMDFNNMDINSITQSL
jgi:hypothetical protein